MTEPEEVTGTSGREAMAPATPSAGGNAADPSGSVSVDLDALRTLAEAPPLGRNATWMISSGTSVYGSAAEFVQACSPEVVLALVEAVQALQVLRQAALWPENAGSLMAAQSRAREALAPFVRAFTEANA